LAGALNQLESPSNAAALKGQAPGFCRLTTIFQSGGSMVIRVGVYGLAQTKPGQGLLAVLDLAEAVRAALHRANLGRPEIVSARYLGAEASGLMEEPARLVSQKILSFRYEIEEDSDEG